MADKLKPFPDGPTGLFDVFDQAARRLAIPTAVGRDVLQHRIVPPPLARTDRRVLASRHGCTIAAVRRCEQTFRRMVAEPDEAVRSVAAEVHERGGPAIPADAVADPEGDPPTAVALLAAVGPWRLDGGWLTDPNGDPTPHVIDLATRSRGRVDPDTAAAALTRWGLRPEWQQRWLTTRPRLRTVPSGDLILWTPAEHRYTYALALLARPAKPETIQQTVGCTGHPVSAKNALRAADNIIRVDAHGRWALTEWGHPEYTSVPNAISDAISELADDSGTAHQIAALVHKRFGVRRHSALTYMSAPRFYRTPNGRIRLRTPNDPWTWRTDPPGTRVGVFPHPDPGTVTVALTVNRNLRGGSGARLPALAAQYLDIYPGDTVTFDAADGSGRTVTASWPDTSMRGPGLSTLRAYTIDASDGDLLRLTLDQFRLQHTAATVAATEVDTAAADPEQARQLLARLTGIPAHPNDTAPSYLQRLADTLRYETVADLVTELETRGDTAAARLITACTP